MFMEHGHEGKSTSSALVEQILVVLPAVFGKRNKKAQVDIFNSV